jgi:hypothetical protein
MDFICGCKDSQTTAPAIAIGLRATHTRQSIQCVVYPLERRESVQSSTKGAVFVQWTTRSLGFVRPFPKRTCLVAASRLFFLFSSFLMSR